MCKSVVLTTNNANAFVYIEYLTASVPSAAPLLGYFYTFLCNQGVRPVGGVCFETKAVVFLK